MPPPPPEPLADAAALIWRRKWALLPILVLWAESFVSWPLSLWLRGRLGSFAFSRESPALALPTGEWISGALESGAVAMVPVARSGWVSVCVPVLAVGVIGWCALAPRARTLEAGERAMCIGLAATACMAAAGNLLGQMVWSRGPLGALEWSWFRTGGAALRTVVVPATLGAVLCWSIYRPLTPVGTRQSALARLALMCLGAGVLLGMPDTLREGGTLGDVGNAWVWLMPVLGCAAALLVAWAIRPAYGFDWLSRPVVLLAVVGVVAAQVFLAGLRGAMPPVETVVILGKSNLDWDGQLSVWGWCINVGIAGVQVALGSAAIAALAAATPEHQK